MRSRRRDKQWATVDRNSGLSARLSGWVEVFTHIDSTTRKSGSMRPQGMMLLLLILSLVSSLVSYIVVTSKQDVWELKVRESTREGRWGLKGSDPTQEGRWELKVSD